MKNNCAISEKFARKLVTRFTGLPRFAEIADSGVDELVRVLRQYCANESHAARSVTAWLNSSRWLPTCAELIEQIDATPEHEPTHQPTRYPYCGVCQGTGFKPVAGPAVKACDCAYGQRLLALRLARIKMEKLKGEVT